MKLLIKQAKVIDTSSPFNGKTIDVLIENGIVVQLSKKINSKADQVISEKGICISPGWVDVFANFCEPGFEQKETIQTGAKAAAAGGFTDVFLIPNTKPSIDNKSQVEYLKHKSKKLPITIHPIGAITKNTDGKELAEMYDMRAAGAVAFSDGTNSVQSAGLMVKALQYAKAHDGVLIQIPDDKSINPHGLMHESVISTQLGLPGKPSISEELMVARDIKLSEYTDSRIHFTGIASKESIDRIKKAKKENLKISCSVTPYHLFYSDENLKDYDSNFKVNPPIRSASDRKALQKAIMDGTIDCIATHHHPHEKDSKVCEFEYAKFGMTGLETAYGVLKTAMPNISDEKLVEIFSTNSRKIFNLPAASIKKDAAACITLFHPNKKWNYKIETIQSKSQNSPFIENQFTGKIIGIINKQQVFLNK